MSSLLSWMPLWAQTTPDALPAPFWVIRALRWLDVLGDPRITIEGAWGDVLNFLKIAGLFSLLGWSAGWIAAARRDRAVPKLRWLDVAAIVSVVGLLASIALAVLGSTRGVGRVAALEQIGISLPVAVAAPFALMLFVWVERSLWASVGRLGKAIDLIVLGGIHLALVLGLATQFFFAYLLSGASPDISWKSAAALQYVLFSGVRLGLTYMGYVVLARVGYLLGAEIIAIRWRRLYSIASLSVIESNRRMWAPWVVLTIFGVILAFTHWFLQPPDQRPAEVGRLYINALMFLCSILITLMVTVLAPISLPNDIQGQTIYTVVSKPVRRLELVWGRMLGFMALVTVLIAIFGGVSLLYLWRNVGGTIRETEETAVAIEDKDPLRARQLREQAAQLRSRMSARRRVTGSLTFLDSKGTKTLTGIDVGQDTSEKLEPRSHIEGATLAAAVWQFGVVPDPYDASQKRDVRVPVSKLLGSGTIEALDNQAALLRIGVNSVRGGAIRSSDRTVQKSLEDQATKDAAEAERLTAEARKLERSLPELMAKIKAAEDDGDDAALKKLYDELDRIKAPDFAVQMNFSIYRTTKGRVGEPVYAKIEVINPQHPDLKMQTLTDIIPIREYYTNTYNVPAAHLVGSNGFLTIRIGCVSPTQYLGMAESDLYILQSNGVFWVNYLLGLFGIWLQAMVLTAIGVFAGTFLSWPMALLTTLAFYIAGQVAFEFFAAIAFQNMIGGGPFESLIRLMTHDNQMSQLSPTLAVVIAKTLDSIIMPFLSRLAYIVPNFGALDVTNTVAQGFEVEPKQVWTNVALALGYALPFSIGGYFILKNREVAA